MLAEAPVSRLLGRAKPRLAPPWPVKSDLEGFRSVAVDSGITLMPWQETAAHYLEAQNADGKHLFREVGIIVSRQNGKTTLLIPLIRKRLLAGRRMMHTAQDRSLPREVFYAIAELFWEHHRDLFPERNGRATKPRYANGQEEIRLTNGAVYSIVAPTRSGARGPSRDDVLLDELRESDTWDFIAAAKPTMTVSPDPQIIYLSNMGDERSVVLNALRDRRDEDPSLAYLEWSAGPDRKADDREGWAEANPALGHEPEGMGSVLDTLEAEYRTAVLEGTLAIFETEHLCRAVATLRPALVAEAAWADCYDPEVAAPTGRTYLGIAFEPEATRAAAALAWPLEAGEIGLRMLYDVPGSPVSTDKFGKDVRTTARQRGAAMVGFDPLTDGQLAKWFLRKEPITGQKGANATARFVELVESKRLHWVDADAVGADLPNAARKEHDESGSFQAVRALDDVPITALRAAIRAVWLASAPKPEVVKRPAGVMAF